MNIHFSCLNNLLCCSICTEQYNGNARRPKLLQCGHTFCTHCLQELTNQLQTHRKRLMLKCPTCRQTTLLLDASCVSQLLDNFAIINCINFHFNEDPEKYCKKHKDEKIKFFCDPCKRLLCPSCALQHVTQKLHKVEKAESAALRYREQIHLAIHGCKEKQNCLDKKIQEAIDEKQKLECLIKSLENLTTNTNDIEFLTHKQIFEKTGEYLAIPLLSNNVLQRSSQSHPSHPTEQSSLAPPGFWCSSSSAESSQQYPQSHMTI